MFPTRGAIALGLTAIALVLLVSFRTPDQLSSPTPGNVAGGLTRGTSGSGASSSGSGASSSGGTGAASAGGTGTRTVAGTTVQTRFGPVQVQLTVTGGQITEVTALQLPGGDRRSMQISSRAEPTLRSEALQAQSANIDGVSGATYTSIGYARSLQAALDAAGL